MNTKGHIALVLLLCAAAPEAFAEDVRTLSFADAVRLATSEAASARLAGINVEQVEATARERRGVLLPQITGTASQANRTVNLATMGVDIPGGEDVVGPFDTFDARLRVSQTILDRAGWMRWRAAQSETDAAGAERAHSEEEAAGRAANASLFLARATATIGAREEDLALAEELLELAVARHEAGTTARIDVTRARAQTASARASLVSARHDERLARVDLCRALGLDPGTEVALADTLDASFAKIGEVGELDGVVERALDTRHDLAAARDRRHSATRELSAARGEWVPKLEVVADAGWSGERANDAETTRQAAVQLSWPLADGLAREARIAREHAAIRAADVEIQDAKDAISAEVRDAWSAIETGRTLEEVAAERDALAREEVDQARLRLQEGMGGNLDVIEAQSSLVHARDAVIDARSRSALARIALARAMGTAADLH